MDDKLWSHLSNKVGASQGGNKSLVLEANMKLIGCSATRPQYGEVGSYCFWFSKKHQRLVNYVWTKIKQDSGSFVSVLFPRTFLYEVAVAVVVTFVFNNTTQKFVFQNFAYSLEASIEPAVLVYGHQNIVVFCNFNELYSFFTCFSKGFLHNNMFACLHGHFGHFEMKIIRSVDNNQLDNRIVQNLVEVIYNGCLRIVFL